MAEFTIKAMTYEESRLAYFTGARDFWARRLAYFEKKIKRRKEIHGELSYLDELCEKASDAAMKLGFYEDAIRAFFLIGPDFLYKPGDKVKIRRDLKVNYPYRMNTAKDKTRTCLPSDLIPNLRGKIATIDQCIKIPDKDVYFYSLVEFKSVGFVDEMFEGSIESAI